MRCECPHCDECPRDGIAWSDAPTMCQECTRGLHSYATPRIAPSEDTVIGTLIQSSERGSFQVTVGGFPVELPARIGDLPKPVRERLLSGAEVPIRVEPVCPDCGQYPCDCARDM